MIELRGAHNEDRVLYKNLFNMYQNDLAQYNGDFLEVDKEGYYDQEATECYFNESDKVIPYIITNNQKVVGIVVLSKSPYVKPGCDFCIQELFVLGSYRGKDIAEEACLQLIDQNRGHYCIAVLKQNVRAKKFWEKFIMKHAVKIEETEIDEQSLAIEFKN